MNGGPTQLRNRRLVGQLVSLVVVSLVLLSARWGHGYMDMAPRSQVSRAGIDMRSVATALESYHVDHNAFPPALTEGLLPVGMLSTPVGYLNAGASDCCKTKHFVPKRLSAVPPGLRRFLFGSLVAALLYGMLRIFIDPLCPRVPPRTIARDVIVIALVGGFLGYCTMIPSSRFSCVVTPLPPGKSDAFDYWTDGTGIAVLRSLGIDGTPDLQGFTPAELSGLPRNVDDATSAILEAHPDVFYDPTNGMLSRGDLLRVVTRGGP